MAYVFDTSPFIVIFKNYYVDRFPSFWRRFNEYIEARTITSVREVRREFDAQDDHLKEWGKEHKEVFSNPSVEELSFITDIYSVEHFLGNLEKKKRLSGGPFADPFVIAKAKSIGGSVVTQEKFKQNGTKIPNICRHFQINCINLEDFLEAEDWRF